MNIWTQRLKAGLCALCLAAAFLAPALASSYTDVADDAWYASAVESMRTQGIMQGTGGGTFSPDLITDRATVVTVLWKIAGSPAAAETGQIFSDVPTDRWYAQAVAWAYELGITTGTDKGEFRPADQITREQLAVFFYRYDLSLGHETASGILDLYVDADQVSSWAVDGMRHAIGAGIVEGSDYQLSPQATATRAELAVMLDRVLTPAAG